MTSGVEIALISGGCTALVGIAGFGAAILNTNRTIKNARTEKLRDWRAEVYVDVLAAVTYRQTKRSFDTRLLGTGDAMDAKAADELLASYKPPDWHVLEARQAAFGSPAVFIATQESSVAAAAANRAFVQWVLEQTQEAGSAARRAQQAADDADDKLLELVRKDLQGEGRALRDYKAISPPAGT